MQKLLQSIIKAVLYGSLISLVCFSTSILSGCGAQDIHHKAPVTRLKGKGLKSAASMRHGKYTVRPGDRLSQVAAKIGYTPEKLAKINRIASPYIIFPGQTLYFSEKSKQQNKSQNHNQNKNKNNKNLSIPTNSSNQIAKKSNTQTLNTHAKLNPKLQNKNSQMKPLAKAEKHANASTLSIKPKNPATTENNLKQLCRFSWHWPARGPLLRHFQQDGKGKGIDIAGKAGAKVLAAAPGSVVYSGNALKGYGNLIIIKHNEEFLSAYAHNQEIMVKEGDRVNIGQEIAKMGQSDSDRVKLHFEIRYKGKPVDPMKLLPK